MARIPLNPTPSTTLISLLTLPVLVAFQKHQCSHHFPKCQAILSARNALSLAFTCLVKVTTFTRCHHRIITSCIDSPPPDFFPCLCFLSLPIKQSAFQNRGIGPLVYYCISLEYKEVCSQICGLLHWMDEYMSDEWTHITRMIGNCWMKRKIPEKDQLNTRNLGTLEDKNILTDLCGGLSSCSGEPTY